MGEREIRLAMRTTVAEKDTIESAAWLSRTSVTRFVIDAAMRQAGHVLCRGEEKPASPGKLYWYEPVEGRGA